MPSTAQIRTEKLKASLLEDGLLNDGIAKWGRAVDRVLHAEHRGEITVDESKEILDWMGVYGGKNDQRT